MSRSDICAKILLCIFQCPYSLLSKILSEENKTSTLRQSPDLVDLIYTGCATPVPGLSRGCSSIQIIVEILCLPSK